MTELINNHLHYMKLIFKASAVFQCVQFRINRISPLLKHRLGEYRIHCVGLMSSGRGQGRAAGGEVLSRYTVSHIQGITI